MAMSTIYTCDKCGFKVDAWDDGNPYVEHPKGKRKYFYHPNDEDIPLLRPLMEIPEESSPEEVDALLYYHVGNAPDHLCCSCAEISQVDPEVDKLVCQHCGSDKVIDLMKMAGKKCPKCSGHFDQGSAGAVS